jgi:Sulfatase-modifying factor enzyme 1/PKD domain
MKRYYLLFLSVFIFAFTLMRCTLDRTPVIPIGATNEIAPAFLSVTITAISSDSIGAKVRLNALGNLTILQHGWVWSETTNPTVQNEKIELGVLKTDSFEAKIPRLSFGKTYYLRPYITTGSGVTYGAEKTMTMNITKLGDIALVTNSACQLLVQNSLQNTVALSDYGIVYLAGTGTPTVQKNDGRVAASGLNNNIFSTNIPNLLPLTSYSVRAYAVSAAGTGYSSVKQITTPASQTLKADFNINTDEELFQGAIVQFTNNSTGTISYSWKFGDGDSSNLASPVHTFNTLGKMLVRLSAKNASGCTTTKDVSLNIIADPFKNYWKNIVGGTFTMGCTAEQGADCAADENPAHQVTLSSFMIGITEVTQGQYKAVVGNNPSSFFQCGLDCPVESVVWNDIVNEFIPALFKKTGRNYALPTEAQWEYAARGGMNTKYAGSNNQDAVAWNSANSGFTPHPVRQKLPNGYGLYDMSGNVSEWCSDWYSATYYAVSPTINPTGPVTVIGRDHVFRGGSAFKSNCRTAIRFVCPSCASIPDLGFRLVRTN